MYVAGDPISKPFSIVVRLIMAHTPCSVSALAATEASGGGVVDYDIVLLYVCPSV